MYHQYAPALMSAGFRRLWVANLTSMMGFWMLLVSQGWLVVAMTDSPFMLGVLAFFRSIPMLVLSPLGGILADRVRKTSLLLAAQGIMAATDLTIGVLVLLGRVEIWHLAVAGVSVGSAFALSMPARTALISDLVPRGVVSNAVALTSTTVNSARVIGPTVAGFLIGLIGIAGTYFTQVGAYLFAFMNIRAINTADTTQEHGGSAIRAMGDGFRYVFRTPTLLALMVLGTSPALFSMPMVMLMPVFVKQDLRSGPQELGVLLGLLGVGAIIGSILVVAFTRLKYKGAAVMLAALMDALLVISLAFSDSLLKAGIVLVLMGVFQAIYLAMIQTILQLITTDRMRGRVISIWMLGWGLTPVGLLPMSAIAESMGTPFAMVLSGSLGVLVAVGVMLFARALWRLTPDSEDAIQPDNHLGE